MEIRCWLPIHCSSFSGIKPSRPWKPSNKAKTLLNKKYALVDAEVRARSGVGPAAQGLRGQTPINLAGHLSWRAQAQIDQKEMDVFSNA